MGADAGLVKTMYASYRAEKAGRDPLWMESAIDKAVQDKRYDLAYVLIAAGAAEMNGECGSLAEYVMRWVMWTAGEAECPFLIVSREPVIDTSKMGRG